MINKIGRLDDTLFNGVSLPPLDRFGLFQASIFMNLSSSESHTERDLNLAP